MTKVWIEAALNGPWTRAKQPGIPVAVDEIVATASRAQGRARRSSMPTPMTRRPVIRRILQEQEHGLISL